MSEIKVNSVVNSTGDNDSGLDLSTNDQVIIKTANTTALTVDSSQNVTLAGNLTVSGTATGVGGGKVLQVKQTVNATPSTISTSEADVMSVQITPSATTSKILVLVSLSAVHANSHSGVARLFRDSTILGGGAGDNPGATALEGAIFNIRTLSIHNIDSHNMTYYDENANSTSQLTYTLKAKSTGTSNGLYINRTISTANNEYNSSVMSTITVIEIGA